MATAATVLEFAAIPRPSPSSSSVNSRCSHFTVMAVARRGSKDPLRTYRSLSTARIPRRMAVVRGVGTLDGFSQGGRGSAFATQMNLFDRMVRVAKSYANAILSSFEDPEKILDQAVLEMNDDLTKMRQATAQVLASQKRLENKYKAAQQASDEWYQKAQFALKQGKEDLAREALKRRKSYSDNAASLRSQLDQQKTVVDNLVSNTRLLESKIQEARSKKDTLKARAQSAKTATKVTEMLGNVSTSSALSAFEKMEEKVMAMESQAEALNQLTTDDLEGQFALLEGSSVDDDLAQLKREVSGSSLKGELPARTAASASSGTFPYRDMDIERELNELRRKANE